MNEQYQRNIKDISNELAGHKTEASAQEDQKFEILYQKEKEIQDFSAKFDSEKAKYEREIADNQKIIAAVLEHMHKNLARKGNLPNQ